ncbi:MAG: cytochrome c biogenesis protein CcdA [Thermoguttaceae bacterium]|nr:cytochrome c biogenesis protein CcdA [Thermoguttaceae bacterium]
MFRFKALSLAAVAIVLAAAGQFSLAQPLGGAFQSSADLLEVTTHTSVDQAPAGSSFEAVVLVDIAQGWKLNAHRPTLEYLIGTELTLQPLDGITVDGIVYPDGTLRDLDFSDEPLAVYEKQVRILLHLRSAPSMPPGDYELLGSLRVQACDANVCLPPDRKAVSIPFRIAEAGAESVATHEELFEGVQQLAPPVDAAEPPASPEAASAADSPVAAMFAERGAVLAFLGIFLMGLALNLTPCVYPMLSITVSLFGGRTGEQRRFGRSFGMAAVYVLGIVSMYTVLGVAAAFTGALFGGWLQSPLVLIGIGTLFFLLALSMFGLYELQVPPALMNKLGGAQQVTGTLGYYLSGLVVGVFAAPCIGPPIIALLAYVAARGDPMFGFLAFFLLSLGLGFPYLILGAFSGLLTKLPKSGAWMVWVRKLFGVVLIGLALFYVALAVEPALAPWAIALTLLLGGVYLGFLERSAAGNRWFTWLKWGIGAAAIVGGVLFVLNLQKESIEWEPYSDQRVAEALEAGRPVMLDFYADWCIPCLELERATFTDRRVIAATERFVRLKVDLTNYTSPESEALREQYNVAGVPTIVFLGSDGQERPEARVVGFLGPAEFLTRVESVD